MSVVFHNPHLDTLVGLFQYMTQVKAGILGEPKCVVYSPDKAVFFLEIELSPVGRIALASIERAVNPRYNNHLSPWTIKIESTDIPKSGIDIQVEGNVDSAGSLVESLKSIVTDAGNAKWLAMIDQVLQDEGFSPDEEEEVCPCEGCAEDCYNCEEDFSEPEEDEDEDFSEPEEAEDCSTCEDRHTCESYLEEQQAEREAAAQEAIRKISEMLERREPSIFQNRF